MSLQEAVEAIQDLADALSGVRTAPDEPVNKITHGVTVITYVQRASFHGISGCERMETTDCQIISDFHTPYSGDFGRAIKSMRDYVESFPDAILSDPTLSSKVLMVYDVLVEQMIWSWGDNSQTAGYRFTTTVKYQASI